jgi:hypothetical protein
MPQALLDMRRKDNPRSLRGLALLLEPPAASLKFYTFNFIHSRGKTNE